MKFGVLQTKQKMGFSHKLKEYQKRRTTLFNVIRNNFSKYGCKCRIENNVMLYC